jgi:HK97 family phage portal protein
VFTRILSAIGLERRSESIALNDPRLAALFSGGSVTNSSIIVTPETAMRCPAVYGSVKILSETLQQLPVHVFRKLPGGGCERADDHPVEPLLNDAANPWTPASEFRLTMQTALSLHGNAFAYVGKRDGVPNEMIWLDPRWVSVEYNPVTMEPAYIFTLPNGQRQEYGRSDLVHVRGIGTRPYLGDSPIILAREAIALALVLEAYAAGLFGRGARPAGILSFDGKLTQDQLSQIRNRWDDHSGPSGTGRTAIMEKGLTWTAMQLSSVDSQFLELRKFQLAEIARIFRTPLHMLNDVERTTHNNAEELGQQFITFCLLPILKAWQGSLALSLLTAEERKTHYIEFVVNDLARADISARFTAYSQAVSAGVLNPNEIREMENRAPYSGGEVFMRPVNTAPAPTDAAKIKKNKKPVAMGGAPNGAT